MPKIIGFCGLSGSGKTSLIERLGADLVLDSRVLLIKHDPKNKARFDESGKDSARFFKTGADVILGSPQKAAIFLHAPLEESLINTWAPSYDYVLVESLRDLVLRRVVVVRDFYDATYAGDFYAYKNIDEALLPKDKPRAGLDDLQKIIEWIKNG